MSDDDIRGAIRGVMQTLKDRQAHLEDGADPDTYPGQYLLGKADGFGWVIGVLETATGVSSSGLRIQPPNAHMRPEGSRWLPQTDSHPFDLPVGDQR